jgi:hypothetical protein
VTIVRLCEDSKVHTGPEHLAAAFARERIIECKHYRVTESRRDQAKDRQAQGIA